MKKELTPTTTKQKLRVSSYGDYIAVDCVDKDGKIISTPFYIKEGETIEAHWGKPSNEQPKYPNHYDDFNDVFQFMMQDGKLLSKWANSGLNSVFELMDTNDLIGWEFHKAHKIRKLNAIPPTTTKGELLQPNFKTLHVGLDSPEDGERWQIINQDGEHILYIESYPLRENAIAICQAVNERQKLLDSNRELLDALKSAMDVIVMASLIDKSNTCDKEIKKIEIVINNAKNIQP